MATTVEELRARITRIEHDLDAVRTALQSMDIGTARLGEERGGYSSITPRYEDEHEAIRDTLAKLIGNLGVDPNAPAPTPEALQRMMLQEGIDPTTNLLSRGIIEMREE